MTDIKTENDEFRTTLRGGRVLMTPAVHELPAELRGRLVARIALFSSFADDDDQHDQGVLIFAGWSFVWTIHIDEQGTRTLTIELQEDLFLSQRETAQAASR